MVKSEISYTIKVGNDFIEEPQTLNPPVVDAFLSVEIREVWYGCEHDSNLIIGLAVELLKHSHGK